MTAVVPKYTKSEPAGEIASLEQPKKPPMKMHCEAQNYQLRAVDPIEDEGSWAIVDDACNSCCHGEHWRGSADQKMTRLGFKVKWLHSNPANFSGIGPKRLSGKLKMPMALKCEESGLILPGAISSHEVPGAERPLLISQSCQAKLGMTKSMRKGVITHRRLRTTAGGLPSGQDLIVHDSDRSPAPRRLRRQRHVEGTPSGHPRGGSGAG